MANPAKARSITRAQRNKSKKLTSTPVEIVVLQHETTLLALF
jgi:hypothetical protein